VVTIAEVLAPFGVAEDEFVAALSHDLHAAPDAAASRLTAAEETILREHGGVTEVVGDGQAVRETVLRSASSNLAELTRESLSVEQAAKLLNVDGSRVRHRVRDRALFAFKIGAGLRLPKWQFSGHDPVPGLRAALAALPADLHPLELAGFMTTPDPDLTVADDPLSPRDWLLGGGDVNAVVELIEHIDAW
jgi:hypothetical protein